MSFGLRRFLLLIFSYIKFIYYVLTFQFLSKNNSHEKSKSILLIKLDDIGDYILFRNLLKYFRLSDKYLNYKITFIGNIEWKEILNNLDAEYVDHICWINKKTFSKNIFYRRNILTALSKTTYDTVINCTLSRNFYLDDTIVKVISAKKKIGSVTDLSNQFLWQKNLSDGYYSDLIPIDINCVFEFDRNKNYLSKILGVQIEQSVPSIEKNKLKEFEELKDNFAVFYVGGKKQYKIWDSENFKIIAKYIVDNFHFKIVLIGNKNDKKIAGKLASLLDEKNLINYVAKTSLIDVIRIINDSCIMVSNDSGLAHISASLNKKTIVVANGTHLGRFFPYPDSNEVVETIYPPHINNKMKDFSELLKIYKYRSRLNINTIDPKTVIEAVNRLLTKTNGGK